MPLSREAVVAALALTATACVFHQHDVACDIAGAACGQNESCALADNGVVCSCGTQQSSNAVCGNGTVCSPDDGACVTNNPPIAVISSVRTDGTLRIPASGSVTLSGADSSDPDGGPLTYAWSFASACRVDASVDLTQATVTFDSSTITAGCVVTLTVTDNLGATDTTQATLVPRFVGGYVSATLPCVAAYQDDSEDPQGTFDNPFCSPDQGVLAAADNAVGQVSLAAESFQLAATLEVGTTPVVGGYTVSRGAPWLQGGGRTSLSSVGATNADVVRMAAPGTSRLANLEIGHVSPCSGSCTTLEVTGTQATLDGVSLRTGQSGVTTQVVAGQLDTVWVHADPDNPTSLNVIGPTVIEGMAATISHALHAEGPVSVTLTGTTLIGGGAAELSAAVRTENVTSFAFTNGQITIAGPGGSSAIAAGYIDGTNSQITTTDSCADGTVDSCAGSQSVAFDKVSVTISGYPTAFGVAAAKTNELTLSTLTATVTAKEAVGVRTLDCTHVSLVTPAITAIAIPGSPSTGRYAAGYFDGYSPGPGTGFSNGSQKVESTGGSIQGLVSPSTSLAVDTVSAVLFYDTQSASLKDTQFVVSSTSSDVGRAAIATAVTTWHTQSFTFENVNMAASNLVASQRLSAFTDGRTQPGSNAASTNLSFTGGQFTVDFSSGGDDGAERAVMQFAGTTMSTVDSATIAFTPAWATAAPLSQAGVWTQATAQMTFKNIGMTEAHANPPSTPAATWIYGFLDGPPEGTDDDATLTAEASQRLSLDRNKVQLGEINAATLIGILLRGQPGGPVSSPPDYRLVTNNVIDVTSDTLDFGIIVDRALAAIYMNTIRYGVCPAGNCPGGGAAIYLQQTQAADLKASIIGNVLTEGSRSAPASSPVVIDLETDSTSVGVANFDYNARGGPTGVILDHEWAFAYSPDRTHFINIPADFVGASDIDVTSKGGTVTGTADGSVTFCDAYHVATAAVASGVPQTAAFVSPALLDKDIDQSSRPWPADAGANQRSECP